MGDGERRPGDILLRALQDLTKPQFKGFKDTLTEINFKGQLNIPRGDLEEADKIDTKNLLVQRYGSDAIEVTIQAFTKDGLMEAAGRLREARKRGDSNKQDP